MYTVLCCQNFIRGLEWVLFLHIYRSRTKFKCRIFQSMLLLHTAGLRMSRWCVIQVFWIKTFTNKLFCQKYLILYLLLIPYFTGLYYLIKFMFPLFCIKLGEYKISKVKFFIVVSFSFHLFEE